MNTVRDWPGKTSGRNDLKVLLEPKELGSRKGPHVLASAQCVHDDSEVEPSLFSEKIPDVRRV